MNFTTGNFWALYQEILIVSYLGVVFIVESAIAIAATNGHHDVALPHISIWRS